MATHEAGSYQCNTMVQKQMRNKMYIPEKPDYVALSKLNSPSILYLVNSKLTFGADVYCRGGGLYLTLNPSHPAKLWFLPLFQYIRGACCQNEMFPYVRKLGNDLYMIVTVSKQREEKIPSATNRKEELSLSSWARASKYLVEHCQHPDSRRPQGAQEVCVSRS